MRLVPLSFRCVHGWGIKRSENEILSEENQDFQSREESVDYCGELEKKLKARRDILLIYGTREV